jgi:serine/threonine-protein kinase
MSPERSSEQSALASLRLVRALDSIAPTRLPPELARRVPLRLRAVSSLVTFALLAGWVLPRLASGSPLFAGFFDWGPKIAVVLASIAMYVVARRAGDRPSLLADLALVYQVVVSYGLAFSQLWGAFRSLDASELLFDRFGFSAVTLWMLASTVLVPSWPRRTLVALVASSLAPLTAYACAYAQGEAPRMDPAPLGITWLLPNAITAVVAYVTARLIHGLGGELAQRRELGAYRLEERIGQGGMGEVWRARHRMLARPAAVKLIRTDSHNRDALRARFDREAQVTATLTSPHTVGLYDFGVSEHGTLYYAMELLDGTDLETLVREHGPLPAERAVYLLRQICRSLGEAHARGLIHRDIKPGNIRVCTQGDEHDFVKVLDFGLVGLRSHPDHRPSLTPMVGTPAYLAPEMVSGGPIDARVDVYALGCVAYWLLTGRRVFDARSALAAALAHAKDKPTPPSQVAELPIPTELEALVLACLEKSPDARPADAAALLARLDACSLPRRWTSTDAASWWALHYGPARAAFAPAMAA